MQAIKKRSEERFFTSIRERITSSLQLLELQQQQERQQQELQQLEQQQQERQQLELQQLVQEQQRLLFYRKRPEPEPTGKRSAVIFS
jgi:hypothetical protein